MVVSSFKQNIRLKERSVGVLQSCFIVAEIGINHNGDMGLAKEEIDAAVEAGADSVKFQNYYTEDFVKDHNIEISYKTYDGGQNLPVKESQFELFKRNELSRKNLEELAEFCCDRKINFHSTPTSQKGINDLLGVGVDILKNGSDFLPNIDFIQALGRTGLPTVLSTGMSTVGEIDDAIQAFRETGNDQLIVLHCNSTYPTEDEDVNISRVKTISDTWGVLSGFSDHTWGISAAVLSVAMGGCWIEKHFTLSKKLKGPDHRFSLDPLELKSLVTAVRASEKQLGNAVLGPTETEQISRTSFRLSCVAASDINPGREISKEDIVFSRPGTGIKPNLADILVGRKILKPIKEGQIFDFEYHFRP